MSVETDERVSPNGETEEEVDQRGETEEEESADHEGHFIRGQPLLGLWMEQVDERDRSWIEDAACVGLDTNLFFPDGGAENNDASVVAAVKRVCEGCPVRRECLSYGLAYDTGIWGGLTQYEMNILRFGVTKTRRMTHSLKRFLTTNDARSPGTSNFLPKLLTG